MLCVYVHVYTFGCVLCVYLCWSEVARSKCKAHARHLLSPSPPVSESWPVLQDPVATIGVITKTVNGERVIREFDNMSHGGQDFRCGVPVMCYSDTHRLS